MKILIKTEDHIYILVADQEVTEGFDLARMQKIVRIYKLNELSYCLFYASVSRGICP